MISFARRTALPFVAMAALAAACGSPEPPAGQGFGAECQFSADCGDGYLCTDATCVPDDIEAPDPVGDGDDDVGGDGDGDGAWDPWSPMGPIIMDAPDCDALMAIYPEATVCTWDIVRVGEGNYDSQNNVPPIAAADLEGCEIVVAEWLHVFESQGGDVPFLSDLKGVCGTLELYGTRELQTISGLGNLTHVVGRLDISATYTLQNIGGLSSLEEAHDLNLANLSITSLSGLDNLKRAGQLRLSYIDAPSLAGLGSLEEVNTLLLYYPEALQSLAGLDALETIHAELSIEAAGQLDDLTGLWTGSPPSVELIGIPAASVPPWPDEVTPPIGLSLVDTPHLRSWPSTRLTGGFGGLYLERTGFASLDMVEGTWSVSALVLADNEALDDLSALDALSGAESIAIYGNPLLDNCAVEALIAPMAAETVVVHDNGGQSSCSP